MYKISVQSAVYIYRFEQKAMPMRVLHCCFSPDGNPSLLSRLHLSSPSASDSVAFLALFVAVLSFIVARKTLWDAEDDWKQQKWFDLYAKADEAYDTFDLYHKTWKDFLNPNIPVAGVDFWKRKNDWDKLLFLIRRVHSMAMVFPEHDAITNLAKATKFDTPEDAFQDERFKMFFDAVEEMRVMARLNKKVLDRRKRTFWCYIKLW